MFGQFVAHDITADRSPLTHHAELAEVRNARSPGPTWKLSTAEVLAGMPFLYDRDDPAKLLVGRNDAGRPDDLPRNPQGAALLDPRNEVHSGSSRSAPRTSAWALAGWRPTLPAAQAGRFGLADLLDFSAQVADATA